MAWLLQELDDSPDRNCECNDPNYLFKSRYWCSALDFEKFVDRQEEMWRESAEIHRYCMVKVQRESIEPLERWIREV